MSASASVAVKSEPGWQAAVAPYRATSPVKAFAHLFSGAGILALCWAGMAGAWSLPYGKLWGLLLALPAGAMLLKLFAIQHDCGHGALFERKWANDLLGRLLCPVVMTPYTQWAREHARHHSTSGNLDQRGIGDVDTWTLSEYLKAPRLQRIGYRILRHPLFLFGPGAWSYFLLKQRLVWFQRDRREAWLSVWSTNFALAGFVVGFCLVFGVAKGLWIWLPSALAGATIGTWIFYIGHQFPETYWAREESWDFFDSAMKGASFYRAGTLMDFAGCNIGYHHIHHLCSRIPFYNLPRCHRDNPQFHVPELGFMDALRCANLALWDERRNRLIPFP